MLKVLSTLFVSTLTIRTWNIFPRLVPPPAGMLGGQQPSPPTTTSSPIAKGWPMASQTPCPGAQTTSPLLFLPFSSCLHNPLCSTLPTSSARASFVFRTIPSSPTSQQLKRRIPSYLHPLQGSKGDLAGSQTSHCPVAAHRAGRMIPNFFFKGANSTTKAAYSSLQPRLPSS